MPVFRLLMRSIFRPGPVPNHPFSPHELAEHPFLLGFRQEPNPIRTGNQQGRRGGSHAAIIPHSSFEIKRQDGRFQPRLGSSDVFPHPRPGVGRNTIVRCLLTRGRKTSCFASRGGGSSPPLGTKIKKIPHGIFFYVLIN